MYRGYFLNLDRNPRRLAAITEHLKALRLDQSYQRFPAINGRAAAPGHPTKLDPGELGVWLTQESLLRAAAGSDAHIHILEDDAILARNAAAALSGLLEHADAQLTGWDLLFTDVLLPLDFTLFSQALQIWNSFKSTGRITLLPLKGLYPAHATSFFVNKNSIGKYLELIEGRWSGDLPIDLHVRALINDGRLNAYTCLPFLSSLSRESEQSDIRGRLDDSRSAFSAYSRAFFVDADHDQLNRELQQLSQHANLPTLAEIYLRALAFTLTDKYQKF